LDFHRKTVSALAANKEIVISGSQDTTIAVWSKENFERMQVKGKLLVRKHNI
jgi:hypothetical protein